MTPPIVDPILRKRAGLNIQLLESWPEIVGAEAAEVTQLLKIIWPRRKAAGEMFEPATLVVACEGFSAVKLQHESSQLIQRINGFFGYCAIARLKIEQKPVRPAQPPVPDKGDIDDRQKDRLEQITVEISDKALRGSLYRLGAGVLRDKNRKRQGRS